MPFAEGELHRDGPDGPFLLIKLTWKDPPRIETRKFPLAGIPEADWPETFEAVKQLLEIEYGS